MKIVHVVPSLIKGGAERVAVALANEAARSGNETTIVAGWPVDPAQLQDSVRPEVTVRFVSEASASRISRYACLPTWLLRQRKWLSRQDIVHCHLTYGAVFGTAALMMRALQRQNRPTFVETYHAVGMPIPKAKRWIHAQLAARRDALAFMGTDEYWRRFVSAHPALLTRTILNGVADFSHPRIPAAVQLSYRRKLGIPEDCRYVVGTVGMLRPDRKPSLYISIFAEIARALGNDVHFIMAGSGSELAPIQSLVRQYGLTDRVHLPGLVLDPRLPLSVMHLYLTLNIGPVAGIAAMEAALCGLPLLAIQLESGYRRKPTDWIWSSSDPRELSDKAIHLLKSDEEREKVAREQGEYVRLHHSIESMAGAYSSLYDSALNRADERVTSVFTRTKE